ncbi:MAG TPA: PD-(D/E)XK nuclease family protein [Bacteroidales bacterium]|nr:PD-(D/E)XK nuclease family protein [Bacteroidales bacterium]
MSFLAEITDIILQEEHKLEDTLIVIPNQRAKRVLQKILSQKIAKTSFLPQILTINELVNTLSLLKITDENQLLLSLYNSCQEFSDLNTKDFSAFLSWGALFLKDINEIDLYLLDATEVFTNLANIKELETSFLNESLSKNQEKYLRFYEKMGDIYTKFTQALIAEKRAYEGLIYRDVAQNIANYAEKLNFTHYYFVGFNAFSPAELKIIRYFQEKCNTELIFDLDKFYFEKNKKNTISPFISSMLKEINLDEKVKIGEHYTHIDKEISIVGVAKQVNQVMYATSIFSQMTEKELDKTAVVLADESLLIPFVHAYDCSNVNLTMGYPFQALPIYHLIETILTLLKNAERFKTPDSPLKQFYYRDIIAFYQNPVLNDFLFGSIKSFNHFIEKEIIKKNRVFFDYADFPKVVNFDLPDFKRDGEELLAVLVNFFVSLKERTRKEYHNFIELVVKELKNIELLLSNFEDKNKIDVYVLEYFIKKAFEGKTIDMKGDADKGLQVMGVLETRVLDFENVIMLSVNEGILPKGKSENSLLLFDIKKHFNLPTYHEKDAIYAYHFFRLLQRAKNIHLIYNYDSTDSLAEPSRFITQLEYEVKNQNLEEKIRINKRKLSLLPHQNQLQNDISIKKDNRIIKKLKEFSYSPTKLITYINCPLQFYLQYIEKIELPQEVSENIERSVIGTVIHKVLEDLLNEIIERQYEAHTILDNYKNSLDEKLIDTFKKEEIFKNDLERGKFYLAYQVIKQYLNAYFKQLEKEIKESAIPHFIGAEMELKTTVEAENCAVSFSGFVDRVQEEDGKIVILDYKTGYVDEKKLFTDKDLEEVFTNSEFKQSFQLLAYSFLYHFDQSDYSQKKSSLYRCGIVSLQSLMKNSDYIHYLQLKEDPKTKSSDIDKGTIRLFEQKLKQLLQTILNTQTNFSQTANSNNCKFCDYKLLCKR